LSSYVQNTSEKHFIWNACGLSLSFYLSVQMSAAELKTFITQTVTAN